MGLVLCKSGLYNERWLIITIIMELRQHHHSINYIMMAINFRHIILCPLASFDWKYCLEPCRDQLDSLGKLRRPSVKSDSSLSWTSHTPKTILQAWAQVDSKNGKLSTNETSPTNRRPSNINSLTAESDTGKEDGELPSTGPTDMDVTMSNTKPAVDTSEIRRDVTEGADSMAVEGTEQGEDTAKEITSDETRATTGSEGETRQQDVEMAEAKAPNAEEETVLPSPENTPGARTFRAVLRRENGASGKRVELEAQVITFARGSFTKFATMKCLSTPPKQCAY